MRVVLDTNVLLSGFLQGRGTRPILEALIARRFYLITSELLVEELADVLSRPEWLRALGPTRCREAVATICEAALFVAPTQPITICRDPADNALLECALAGRVDYLVTGDHDLLVLDPFRGIPIVRPREFLRLIS